MVRIYHPVKLTQFKEYRLAITYADIHPRQKLDIYYPESGREPYPTLVLFHSGGLVGGSRDDAWTLGGMLTATHAGWAVVSVGYRLALDAHWPAPVLDAKLALKFIRDHADELRVDPANIVTWGSSAGSTVTNGVASTWDKDALNCGVRVDFGEVSPMAASISWHSISCFTEFGLRESFDVDVTVGSMTVDHERKFRANPWRRPEYASLGFDILEDPVRAWVASPIYFVSERFIPTLLQHGSEDEIISPTQSLMLHSAAIAATGDTRNEFDLIEGAGHSTELFRTSGNILRCLRWADMITGRIGMYPDQLPEVEFEERPYPAS